MATYSIGELIKYLRTQKGISQEKLCEGICSVATLSKVERGTQVLSKYNFDAIMQRLGENADKYFSAFVGAGDFESFQMREQLHNNIVLRNYARAEELISSLLKKENFKEGLNLQFLLSAEASMVIGKIRENGAQKDACADLFKFLLQAIKITKPRFDENKIHTYLLTNDEAEIINKLSLAYEYSGNREMTIKILYALKESLENSIVDFSDKANKYTLILYNLSKYLGLSGRYPEAIEIAEIGRKVCIKADEGRLLPKLIFNKACGLNEIGDKESCLRLLRQAYYGMDMLEEFQDAQIAKDYAEKNFGIVL